MEMENGNGNVVEPVISGSENNGVPGNSAERGPKWVVARTVLGILSIILFVMVMFQSCAAGLGNALSDNGEVSGSAGFMCALNLLVAGLIVLVARKTVKKAPMIVAAVLMYLNLFYSQVMAGSYKDLVIWGFLSFAFGIVYLFSVLHTKKQFIIAGVITAVYMILMIMMGGASDAKPKSENKGAAVEETAAQQTIETEDTSLSRKSEDSEDAAAAEMEKSADGEENEGTADVEQVEEAVVSETEAETPPVEEKDTSGEKTESAAQGPAWETGEGKVLVAEDSIGTTWVQTAVPVENTGSVNLYLSSGTMDLEDAEGHLVDSLRLVSVHPDVIKPGETAWYFEETTLDERPSSDLKVIPHVDVKEATVDCIRYETSDVTISEEEFGGIKVTGSVENTTDEDGSLVVVAVFLYDENGDFIGNINTYLDGDLAAGDKVGFSASSFADVADLTAADIADYKIYAYPTQYQF